MKKRFTNPLFLLGVSGLVWQFLVANKVPIEFEQYKQTCDLLSYLFIGAGLYSTFETPKKDDGGSK